jgi:hypothetical protein
LENGQVIIALIGRLWYLVTLLLPLLQNKEAIRKFFKDLKTRGNENEQAEDGLLNRKEITDFFRIFLVTLNDWVNRELYSHKQRGRVYFDKAQVKDYNKTNKIEQLKFGTGLKKVRQEIA